MTLDDYEDLKEMLTNKLLESREAAMAAIISTIVRLENSDKVIFEEFTKLASHLTTSELGLFAKFPELSHLTTNIPARTGIAWTPEEDEYLARSLSDESLARILQRTAKAVKVRRASLATEEEFITE